ncbi:MAG: MFS transporter [archaeon]|nr:MFS transporter [archaeon]MCP8319878.1 MFS transporter [archaeon]
MIEDRDKDHLDSSMSSRVGWTYSVVPVSIALGPISTMVQLLILQLNGTIIEVGLATTLFSVASIPAAIVWGFATDRLNARKLILVVSYLSVALLLILFSFAQTTYEVTLLYTAFSFVSSASVTPLSLLIMETQPKSHWASAFARLSMLSSVGTTLGLLLSVGWADLFPIRFLVVPLSILTVSSAILSFILIEEPTFLFERRMLIMHRASFHERLKALPIIFLKIPGFLDFKKVFRNIRYELTRGLPILYFSIFAFYLSSGIFNTSLAPALYMSNIPESQVFLVILVGMVVQAISFVFSGQFTERRNLTNVSLFGLALRAICYAFIGISALLLAGLWLLFSTLIFYPIAAGIAFAVYYTASNTMVFNTIGEKSHGSSLGVYSAIVGVATTLGSFISGFSSFYLGYHITFILAAILLALSAVFTSMLKGERCFWCP